MEELKTKNLPKGFEHQLKTMAILSKGDLTITVNQLPGSRGGAVNFHGDVRYMAKRLIIAAINDCVSSIENVLWKEQEFAKDRKESES